MNILCKKAWIGLTLLLALSGGVFGWMYLSNTNGTSAKIVTRDNLQFGISKTFYTRGETVTFWIKNIGKKSINMGSPSPWRVEKRTSDGWKIVFSPPAAAVLVPIKPGEKVTWHWDQTNVENESVYPRVYRVFFHPTSNYHVTLSFTISTIEN